MSYLALCTFDLKSASRQDYETAYSDLEKLGLKKIIVANNGNNVVIPTTTVTGSFTGQSASSVCEYVRDKVKSAFSSRSFSSEIFVMVGGDWSWAGSTT